MSDEYDEKELEAFDIAVSTIRYMGRRIGKKEADSAMTLAAAMGVIQAATQANLPGWARACVGTEGWGEKTEQEIGQHINARMEEVRQRAFNTALGDYMEHRPEPTTH